MDLKSAFSEAKSLPDEALMKELHSPSGMLPGYIVLGEMNERRALRSGGSKARQSIMTEIKGYAGGGMVQHNPFNSYVNALKFKKSLDKTTPEAAGASLPSLPMLEAAVGLPSLVPLQPGVPEQPRRFARGGLVDMTGVEEYIRKAAMARGINPDIAVRVAKSEGLAPGVWQSNASRGGVREPSFGPYQLLVGGEGTNYPAGMGNDFMQKTGLDPRNPATVNQQVDFALDQALNRGWKPWYGAAKAGIGQWEGLRGAAAQTPAPSAAPVTLPAASLPQMAAQQAAAQVANTQAATQAATQVASQQAAQMASAQAARAAVPVAPTPSPFGGLLSMLPMLMAASAPPPPPMGGGAPPKFTHKADTRRMVEETSQTPDVYRKRRRYA